MGVIFNRNPQPFSPIIGIFRILASLLLVALLVAAVFYAHRRGIQPPDYAAYASLSDVWSGLRGEYPPGPATVYFVAMRWFGVPPVVLNGLFALGVAGALAALVALTRREGEARGFASLIARTLLVLNIYGVWLMVTSKDTALENLFFLWGAAACFALARFSWGGGWLWPAACVLPPMAGLMRVTAFITGMSLMVAFPARRTMHRLAPLGVIVAVALAYGAWNYRMHGRFSLTTTTGANLFLGQHPHYTDVHPCHDIETLEAFYRAEVERIVGAAAGRAPSAGEIDAALGRRAIDFVRKAPGEAVARSGRKAVWYFFGITKIPVFTDVEPARMALDGSLDPGRRDIRFTLAYLPYGLLYVGLFWTSFVWFLVRRDRERLALYVPFFVMGLVAVVLFPDTRFRQAAELLTYVPIAHAVAAWGSVGRKRWNKHCSSGS